MASGCGRLRRWADQSSVRRSTRSSAWHCSTEPGCVSVRSSAVSLVHSRRERTVSRPGVFARVTRAACHALLSVFAACLAATGDGVALFFSFVAILVQAILLLQRIEVLERNSERRTANGLMRDFKVELIAETVFVFQRVTGSDRTAPLQTDVTLE